MQEALRLKTKDARFFYHAGMIEKETGDKKGAKEFLQKALQLNPAFDVLQTDKAKTALQQLS
ncbi:MAG: tetratricopeptide repeat protein [Pyrinomonadaceae bacterium]